MSSTARPRWMRYGLAVLSVAGIAALEWGVIDPTFGAGLSCQHFLLAVTLAAWYGGMAPGLWAAGLSALVCTSAILVSRGSLRIGDPEAVFRLAVFLGEGTLIGWSMGRLHAERDRAARAGE